MVILPFSEIQQIEIRRLLDEFPPSNLGRNSKLPTEIERRYCNQLSCQRINISCFLLVFLSLYHYYSTSVNLSQHRLSVIVTLQPSHPFKQKSGIMALQFVFYHAVHLCSNILLFHIVSCYWESRSQSHSPGCVSARLRLWKLQGKLDINYLDGCLLSPCFK